MLNAFLVGYLIDYFAVGDQGGGKTNALIYATVIAVMTLFISVGHYAFDYHLECLGLQLRSAISSLVYEKVSFKSCQCFLFPLSLLTRVNLPPLIRHLPHAYLLLTPCIPLTHLMHTSYSPHAYLLLTPCIPLTHLMHTPYPPHAYM